MSDETPRSPWGADLRPSYRADRPVYDGLWPVDVLLHVTRANDEPLTAEEAVYTLSPDPQSTGWSTDGGFAGYGLRREVAEAIARNANFAVENAAALAEARQRKRAEGTGALPCPTVELHMSTNDFGAGFGFGMAGPGGRLPVVFDGDDVEDLTAREVLERLWTAFRRVSDGAAGTTFVPGPPLGGADPAP